MAPSPQNTSTQASDWHLNDLVSLPIIITDFDAERERVSADGSNKKLDEQSTPRTASPTASSAASDASLQKWATGFNDFADEMWRSMTEAMRTKLRDAAVEVLRRTDDAKSGAHGGQYWGDWDDDARFLD